MAESHDDYPRSATFIVKLFLLSAVIIVGVAVTVAFIVVTNYVKRQLASVYVVYETLYSWI